VSERSCESKDFVGTVAAKDLVSDAPSGAASKVKLSLLSNYPNAAAERGGGRITVDAREKENTTILRPIAPNCKPRPYQKRFELGVSRFSSFEVRVTTSHSSSESNWSFEI
jgi:hypothetical protein